MFVYMRQRFVCVSIRLLLMHRMKALRAYFFARESASKLMAQTQRAELLQDQAHLQTLPWATISLPSLRIMGPHGPTVLSMYSQNATFVYFLNFLPSFIRF